MLILKDIFKLITDISSKDLIVFKIFLKKIFKLSLSYLIFNFQ